MGVETADDDDDETCCRGYFCLSMSISIRCCSSPLCKLICKDRDVTNRGSKTNQTNSCTGERRTRAREKGGKSSPLTYSHTQTIRLISFYSATIIILADSYQPHPRLQTIIRSMSGSSCIFECHVHRLALIHSTQMSDVKPSRITCICARALYYAIDPCSKHTRINHSTRMIS